MADAAPDPAARRQELMHAFVTAWPTLYKCPPSPPTRGTGLIDAIRPGSPARSRLAGLYAPPDGGEIQTAAEEADPKLLAFAVQYAQVAVTAGQRVATHPLLYAIAFVRLGVQPEEVFDHLRAERAVLADLGQEARRSRPSHERLTRLALRLAVDARHEYAGRCDRIEFDAGGLPEVWQFGDDPLPFSSHRTPNRRVSELTPPAVEVLCVFKIPPDFQLVDTSSYPTKVTPLCVFEPTLLTSNAWRTGPSGSSAGQ